MSKATPVRHVPGTVTEVDIKTGKETHKGMAWNVMPPAPDRCQICAAKHGPEEPHNAQSLYYQTIFSGMHGRAATWADAIAHCSPELGQRWKEALADGGHWTEPPDGEEPIKHHGVDP